MGKVGSSFGIRYALGDDRLWVSLPIERTDDTREAYASKYILIKSIMSERRGMIAIRPDTTDQYLRPRGKRGLKMASAIKYIRFCRRRLHFYFLPLSAYLTQPVDNHNSRATSTYAFTEVLRMTCKHKHKHRQTVANAMQTANCTQTAAPRSNPMQPANAEM